MNIRAFSFLAFTFVAHAMGYILERDHSIFVGLNQKFSISSHIKSPYLYYTWKNEDEWQLEDYPLESITLKRVDGMAPDGCGGDLLQFWDFIAKKRGDFTLKFKRFNHEIAVQVHVN